GGGGVGGGAGGLGGGGRRTAGGGGGRGGCCAFVPRDRRAAAGEASAAWRVRARRRSLGALRPRNGKQAMRFHARAGVRLVLSPCGRRASEDRRRAPTTHAALASPAAARRSRVTKAQHPRVCSATQEALGRPP